VILWWDGQETSADLAYPARANCDRVKLHQAMISRRMAPAPQSIMALSMGSDMRLTCIFLVINPATDLSDEAVLLRLNQEYVDAFMNADVNWYHEHLADDFEVVESDGSVLNKIEFLESTAKGPDVIDYRLETVGVRVFGDVALVRATGLWTGKNGYKGLSRYTDVYLRTADGWKTVSAQITRATIPGPRGSYKRPRR